ncbi:MAG: DUF6371 domain-containing protein [Saprospiraceae bacterium]|jgi:hypothetical protein|nr:DUF6371 domain-containing protein [Saprospiraceae bacterium]
MKTGHRYFLEPYKGMKTRYYCPSCQQRDKTFSLYIDRDTGEYIHSSVGRCNRESNCGHHYTPKQYFHDNNIPFNTLQPKAYKTLLDKIQPKLISFIPVEIFKSSLNPKAFENNYFVEFLINLFDVEITSQLVSRYFIATSKHWNGASVFWQIDLNGKVRTGKIILYDPTTGKRVKNQELPVFWVHKALMLSEFNLKQCLFGTHLLIDKTYPVAIVESEKTAIIASVYLPQFIWLATGGLNNLNAENCCYLKDRNVTLFPDLNGFEKWNNKAKTLSHIAKFTVSDLLERNATEEERKQGLDLADYLIRFNYKEFNIESTKPILDEEILIELQPNNENNIIQSHTSPAYLTDSGVLYIETPNWITYSFYPSIDHYNKRLCLPDFIDKTNIDITKFKVVQIDLKSLTINLN